MKNGFYIINDFDAIDALELDELTFKVVLEGTKMKDIASFHQELQLKLEIPDYFGKNWDALSEVLNDLSWLDFDNFVIMIRDYDSLLADEEFEQKSEFLCILDDTMDEWENVPNYEGEEETRSKSLFCVHVAQNTQIVEELILLELDNSIVAD